MNNCLFCNQENNLIHCCSNYYTSCNKCWKYWVTHTLTINRENEKRNCEDNNSIFSGDDIILFYVWIRINL